MLSQLQICRYETQRCGLSLSWSDTRECHYHCCCRHIEPLAKVANSIQVLEHKCHPSIHPLYPTTNAISVLMIPTKILRFAMIGIKIKYFKMNWSITIASTNNLQIERARARCKSITDEEIFSLRGCENTQVKRRFTIIQTSHF